MIFYPTRGETVLILLFPRFSWCVWLFEFAVRLCSQLDTLYPKPLWLPIEASTGIRSSKIQIYVILTYSNLSHINSLLCCFELIKYLIWQMCKVYCFLWRLELVVTVDPEIVSCFVNSLTKSISNLTVK